MENSHILMLSIGALIGVVIGLFGLIIQSIFEGKKIAKDLELTQKKCWRKK